VDDHEVVNDFAGAAVDRARFEAGRQAFREYMPIDDTANDPTRCTGRCSGRRPELTPTSAATVPDRRRTSSTDGEPTASRAAAAPDAPDKYAASASSSSCRRMCRPLPRIDHRSGEDDARRRTEAVSLRPPAQPEATWRVIVNEVPMQAFGAAYDRWRLRRRALGVPRYATTTSRTSSFSRLTHANIFGPVNIDPFDKTAVAYEAVVGPIATAPLEKDIVDAIGAAGGPVRAVPHGTGRGRVRS
jgi:hypothetical protein